jgi:HSP20 family protein
MIKKEAKELIKADMVRPLSTFFDLAKWFEEFPRRSLSSIPLPNMMSEELVPNVDIYEDDGSYVLKAELPGMKKEDIDITLTGDDITISGEKKNTEEIKKKDYYRGECSYGAFSRTFSLPGDVQANKVTSKFIDGVLEIRMPKSEEAKKKEVKLKIQ